LDRLRHLLQFAFALAVLVAGQPLHAQLAAVVDQQLATPALEHAIAGVDIEDDAGNVLYARNAHTLLMPASNRKLFAAATAVSCLGFDHRVSTELWRDGRDLVIRGGGDPALGGRYAFDRDAVFAPFVDALLARGITVIEGDLIADVSAFDRIQIPGSWKYGNLGADYAAPVDALTYNENVAGVVAEHCPRPVVVTDPPFLAARADVTCDSGEPAVRVDATNTVTLTGVMDEKKFDALTAIADPGLYAAQALRDALHHAGIEVRGTLRVQTAPRPWQEQLAAIPSLPLASLLATTLKVSQNLYAETLLKDAGDGTYAGAFDHEREFLTGEAGIDGHEFRFVDGCGLAPDDLVTPAAIVKLLRWMNDPARRGMWWELLATPGEEGTLHRRLLDLAPRLRGKTGSIAGVNALSCIIAGQHAGYRYVSVVLNHHVASTSEALHAIDAIVKAAAEF
jgi:D-alanyl-D-alanine carboxypeptidase/D-alanyl-D-alanine-endopeptidase (penicillin-binding protein 4)